MLASNDMENCSGERPRVIGVVGGLGPFAGLDLVRKILRHTAARKDQEHLPLMLCSFPGKVPERPTFLLGQSSENPGDAIGDIMCRLARGGAEVIGMPCNTAHSPGILDRALEKLYRTSPEIRFISIIRSAVEHIRALQPAGGPVGLMGTEATLRTGLYQNALAEAGLEAVIPDGEDCELMQKAISDTRFGIKAFSDPVTQEARTALLSVAQRLIAEKHVSLLLLGCTEIPLAVTETLFQDIPVVDATDALARELVRASCPERLA